MSPRSAECVHPEDGGTTFFQMLTPICQTRHYSQEDCSLRIHWLKKPLTRLRASQEH
jgi:hypothetical protein